MRKPRDKESGKMAPGIQAYKASEILDRTDPKNQGKALGSLVPAISDAVGHLLNTLAAMPCGTASIGLLFSYEPNEAPEEKQTRLTLYMTSWAADAVTARILALLVEDGPLARFANLRRDILPETLWKGMNAACDVIRAEEAFSPLFGREFNRKLPAAYYQVRSFEPNEDNDYLVLDSVLDRISERVLIQVCVESADICLDRAAMTQYRSRLQEINCTWDEQTDRHDYVDYFGKEQRHLGRDTGVVPLPKKKDPMADAIFSRLRDVHDSLHRPHVLFHVRVLSRSAHTAHFIASVLAECAFLDGSYRLTGTGVDAPQFPQLIECGRKGRVALVPSEGGQLREQEPELYAYIHRFAQIATPQELVGAFRFPIGSRISPRTVRQNTDPSYEEPKDMIILGYDWQDDRDPIDTGSCGLPRGLRLEELIKHMAIFGMSGSGKTTCEYNICIQLYEHNIPFILIEPVKTEARILKVSSNSPAHTLRNLARDLRVYTPGREHISPLASNPFIGRVGAAQDERVETFFECLKATMPVSGPLPALLREGLDQLYENYPDPQSPPTISDFLVATHQVLARKSYAGEVSSNLRGALEVRVGDLCRGSVGKVFRPGINLPRIDELVSGYSIIELDALTEESACKLMLFLLRDVCEYVKTVRWRGDRPRLVILIDEARILVGPDTKAVQSEDFANPMAFTSRHVSDMLCVFRALGVGVIIADQSPSAVSATVVKMTGAKLAHRTSEAGDREMLAGAMQFGDFEMQDIARLRTGEAYFIKEGYYRPRRIRTVNAQKVFAFPPPPTDDELKAHLADEPWLVANKVALSEAKLERLAQALTRLDSQRAAIALQAVHLRAQELRTR
jgi:hypothetical protein